jgi:predicted  nucleic acid-binding Zn-ribbon protein
MRKIAREEAQKALHESQVPFLKLQDQVLALENKVRELERRAHDHPLTQ